MLSREQFPFYKPQSNYSTLILLVMAVTSIVSFTASAPVEETIQKLTQALEPFKGTSFFVVGTVIQEPSIIQITSEWLSFNSPADLSTSPTFQSFTNAIKDFASLSKMKIIFATFEKSPFASGTASIVEYVKTDFPAFSTVPSFQKQIEVDFARFESIYRNRGTAEETGEVGLTIGWTEEQDDVRSFMVMRGWKSMERFQESVETEIFKECIPILLGWNMPFNLVSQVLQLSVVSANR